MSAAEFRPAALLRGPHLQSLLASSPLKSLALAGARRELARSAKPVVLTTPQGVRLSGYYDPAPRPPARGLAVLLHGWEGSAHSLYLIDAAAALREAGFSLFRLQFRDHGNSHHLNPELFHSCRLEEVVEAFRWIAAQYAERPLFAVGFSLGGNFALRVALRAPAAGLPLAGVCAVCPVIDPAHGLAAIERAPRFYEQYFLAKWRASLRRKRALFPERYRFDDRALRRGLRDLTAWLVAEYTEYPSLAAYLDGYSVAGERLAGLEVPVRILTSADDPVIPVEDFRRLALPDSARLTVLSGGGHCAFLADWSLRSAASAWIVGELRALREGRGDATVALAAGSPGG